MGTLIHGWQVSPWKLALSIVGADNHDLPNVTPPVLVVALVLLREGLRVEQCYRHLTAVLQLLYLTTAPDPK